MDSNNQSHKIKNVFIKPNTIFVSIASYRDPVCNSTLQSLFNMASNPKNIYVGICQQNNPDEDQDCLLNFENHPNVRIIRIPHYEAKGPTWARYLCSTLWNGEQYFLQVDSHTSFVNDWDTKCINMIKNLQSKGYEKPLLSHYPRAIEEYNNYNIDENNNQQNQQHNMVPRICQAFFNERDMISFHGAEIHNTYNDFYETPFIAAGFVFADSRLLSDVPFDPNLPYLFVGEEINYSIRAWTSGWNVFTPSENIVFHEYTRSEKPKIWTDNVSYSDINAFEKVKQIIGLKSNHILPSHIKENIDKYGLGISRSLQDYFDFAGIDPNNKKIYKNFCKPNNSSTEHFSLSEYFSLGSPDNFYLYQNWFLFIVFIIFMSFVVQHQRQQYSI
jgi:hypothetical protein